MLGSIIGGSNIAIEMNSANYRYSLSLWYGLWGAARDLIEIYLEIYPPSYIAPRSLVVAGHQVAISS